MTFDPVQTGLALAEGFGLAFSPCILPILPFILATSASQSRLRPFLIILGFVFSFTIFSLISRQILAASGIQQDTIQTGAYVLLLIFGIVMVVPYFEEKFANLTGGLAGSASSLSSGKFADTTLGGMFVGVLIGLVWIPCAGPILAAALLQVIQSQTSFEAVATIAAFSIGAGIPMLMIALFGQYMTKHFRALAKHSVVIRRVMGTVIIIFAVLALSGFSIAEWAVTRTAEDMGMKEARSTQSMMTDTSVVTGLQDGLTTPYPAPEIAGIQGWINSNPLTMQQLKGKVVLVDFWTYSCINCIRTLPYVTSWYEKYKDQGFVVLGVHTPEFAFEAKKENVEAATKKFKINYPVALDNNFGTWNNFDNKYWPAHYLIDKQGNVVYTHFGEGHYDVTENNIRYLLGLQKAAVDDNKGPVTSENQTPETYVGNHRAERESTSGDLPLHSWKVDGAWKRTDEYLESAKAGDSLTLHFGAKKVFLVMESADGKPVSAQIDMDGKSVTQTADVKNGTATIQQSRLYEIVSESGFTDGTVTIKATTPGLRLFAFTFEG